MRSNGFYGRMKEFGWQGSWIDRSNAGCSDLAEVFHLVLKRVLTLFLFSLVYRLRHGFRSQQRCIKLLHRSPDRLLITGCFLSTVLHQNHFRKDWQLRVRTWFDQPGRKLRRRQARKAKAATLGVRPLNLLRPAVRGQTVRYNRKIREGRGFTLAELKEAGIGKKEARGVGIVVDHRRRNLSEEGKALNVERLKAYKTRLIVFPRNVKKPKKGDSTVSCVSEFTIRSCSHAPDTG